MSASRAKGTKFENELLVSLRSIWPGTDRAKAGNQSNDFHGPPFPIEAKHRKRWDIPAWVKALKVVAGGDRRWALICAPGDRRLVTAPPTVMVVPLEFGLELLEAWAHVRED